MESDFSRIQALVQRPGESLAIEIKRWIDPDQPEGKCILVKAALALRNYGGGYIVIGFDNDSLEPDRNNVPPDVKALFHIDKIQGLISKYASELFEVTVEFPERDGQPYPVIVIPPGVKTPVAVKSDLRIGNAPPILRTDSIYIRSLNANNTPSSTIATWKSLTPLTGHADGGEQEYRTLPMCLPHCKLRHFQGWRVDSCSREGLAEDR
jgi:hypothetical protein